MKMRMIESRLLLCNLFGCLMKFCNTCVPSARVVKYFCCSILGFGSTDPIYHGRDLLVVLYTKTVTLTVVA